MDSSQPNLSPLASRTANSPAEPCFPPTLPAVAPTQDKVRFRFAKQGLLRLLSHHDLLRLFERLLRRSQLPYRRTQGFNPHPRLIFALSLPLGVVGCEEVAELELDEILPTQEILERLQTHAPPGISIQSVRRIPFRSTAQVCRLGYRLPLPPHRVPSTQTLLNSLLSQETLWITRGQTLADQIRPPAEPLLPPTEAPSPERAFLPRPPGANRVNLRPFLRDLRITAGEDAVAFLEMDLWLLPAGTAKPVEILGLLNLLDLLNSGSVLERFRLELHDEQESLPGAPPCPSAIHEVKPTQAVPDTGPPTSD